MALWTRRRTVPAAVTREWRDSLPTGASHRVLAASGTVGGWMVLSVTHLSVRGTDETWAHTGWHEIEHGGWNVEIVRLQWTRTDGRRGSVHLSDPGSAPGVFRDRVKASFVFTDTIMVNETAGIVVSARRDLADPGAPLQWHTTLQRGLTWQQPGVRELADEALARYRNEFDPS